MLMFALGLLLPFLTSLPLLVPAVSAGHPLLMILTSWLDYLLGLPIVWTVYRVGWTTVFSVRPPFRFRPPFG